MISLLDYFGKQIHKTVPNSYIPAKMIYFCLLIDFPESSYLFKLELLTGEWWTCAHNANKCEKPLELCYAPVCAE